MKTMLNKKYITYISICCIAFMYTACIPTLQKKKENTAVPGSYKASEDTKDSTNTADIKWKDFFKDPNLVSLIDTALKNNQELNIIMQEINIAQNEVRSRKGKYLPFVNLFGGASVDKQGKYTRLGAVDDKLNFKPGQSNPDPLTDFLLSANVSWQIDIWKQLRNSKKAAVYKYLSTIEGKNFMVTNLIAEIVYSYYDLLALDNQLEILKANIEIQQNALKIVTLQKAAGAVTELAVRRFQAEVNKNQSRQYYIEQEIIEAQNRINFLAGRFPQVAERNSTGFIKMALDSTFVGIPSQLLENRPDIKQAELELSATKLDVKVAKANFYPTLNIMGGIGLESFDPKDIVVTPESVFFNLAGGLMQPLVNRNAIKAEYLSANSRQIKAVYNYERTILKAFTEVSNQLSNISNLSNSYDMKMQQVDALNQSVSIAITLFKSARADYMEVLLTQRDALESKMELIETKQKQMNAIVKMYQVLGGGWK